MCFARQKNLNTTGLKKKIVYEIKLPFQKFIQPCPYFTSPHFIQQRLLTLSLICLSRQTVVPSSQAVHSNWTEACQTKQELFPLYTQLLGKPYQCIRYFCFSFCVETMQHACGMWVVSYT